MKIISEAFGRRLEKKGITRIQWIALYYLGLNGNFSQRHLARCMNIKDSSATRLVDRMQRDGLIKRKKNPDDRRVTYLVLTKKGESMRDEILPEGEKFSKILLDGIDDKELEIFEKVLKKMVNNIEK